MLNSYNIICSQYLGNCAQARSRSKFPSSALASVHGGAWVAVACLAAHGSQWRAGKVEESSRGRTSGAEAGLAEPQGFPCSPYTVYDLICTALRLRQNVLNINSK